MDVLPQYSNPFKGGKLGHPNFGQPISMTLTPNELREMQKIVEGLDVEDQHQKGKLNTKLAMMHGGFVLIHIILLNITYSS